MTRTSRRPTAMSPHPERMSLELCTSVRRFGWLLCALAGGVLSCNAILGIGEASLRCDTDPCTTDVASATPGVVGGPEESAAEESTQDVGAARSGAGGAPSEVG